MATIKVTKVQRFADIKALLMGEAVSHGTTVDEALDFIDNEVELITKKNASKSNKQTATQKENEVYKDLIVSFLSAQTEGKTCTEILHGVPELNDKSTSKVSALMRALIADGKVAREEDKKGKALFFLA